MMHFQGGSIGHNSTWEATDFFRQDQDQLDVQSIAAGDLDIDSEAAEIEKNDEGNDSGTDEDAEDDYGYMKEQSDSSEDECEEEELTENEYFGGGLDPDIAEVMLICSYQLLSIDMWGHNLLPNV